MSTPDLKALDAGDAPVRARRRRPWWIRLLVTIPLSFVVFVGMLASIGYVAFLAPSNAVGLRYSLLVTVMVGGSAAAGVLLTPRRRGLAAIAAAAGALFCFQHFQALSRIAPTEGDEVVSWVDQAGTRVILVRDIEQGAETTQNMSQRLAGRLVHFGLFGKAPVRICTETGGGDVVGGVVASQMIALAGNVEMVAKRCMSSCIQLWGASTNRKYVALGDWLPVGVHRAMSVDPHGSADSHQALMEYNMRALGAGPVILHYMNATDAMDMRRLRVEEVRASGFPASAITAAEYQALCSISGSG